MTTTRGNTSSILSALIFSLALIFGMGALAAGPAHAASPFAGTYAGTSNGYKASLEVSADGKVTYFNAKFWFFCNGISTLNTAYWDTPVAVDSAGKFSKKLSDESISGTINSKGEASVYYKSFYLGCAGDVGVTLEKAPVDVYTTPGTHHVNGRDWRTTCEPYSQTTRCETMIKATQVTQVNGRFVSKMDWTFNNLTYKESPRALWKGNPLGENKSWTAADGRKWRTECDTAATGRNGCRTYTQSRVIEAYQSGGKWNYRWATKWVFNNIVRFKG